MLEKIIKIIEEDMGIKVKLTIDSYKKIYQVLENKKMEIASDYLDVLKIRKELKLTQTQFAEKIGVKRGTIAQIEIGKNEVSANVRKKIANFIHNNNGNN